MWKQRNRSRHKKVTVSKFVCGESEKNQKDMIVGVPVECGESEKNQKDMTVGVPVEI
jgi:hypothetical protein